MGHHGANFQSDLVLIPVEKTQGLEAFPFSQPPLQSRSVVLTSLELRLQFLIQVHGGARISQSFHEHQKKSKEHIQTHHPAHTWTYPKCLVVEVASGACHLETVLLAVFHDLFLWWRPHRMAPKHSQTIIPNGFT